MRRCEILLLADGEYFELVSHMQSFAYYYSFFFKLNFTT